MIIGVQRKKVLIQTQNKKFLFAQQEKFCIVLVLKQSFKDEERNQHGAGGKEEEIWKEFVLKDSNESLSHRLQRAEEGMKT